MISYISPRWRSQLSIGPTSAGVLAVCSCVCPRRQPHCVDGSPAGCPGGLGAIHPGGLGDDERAVCRCPIRHLNGFCVRRDGGADDHAEDNDRRSNDAEKSRGKLRSHVLGPPLGDGSLRPLGSANEVGRELCGPPAGFLRSEPTIPGFRGAGIL